MATKNILILGGGNGGTMLSNKLRHELSKDKWNITVIDRDNRHIYQPSMLLVPFGLDNPKKIVKPRNKFFKPGVNFVQDTVTHIDTENKKVTAKSGKVFPYDFLVISTGCSPDPAEDEGLEEAMGKNAFTFYNLESSIQLGKALKEFKGGKLVVDIAALPIKCPVAPLEFSFLADWYFKKKGIRNKVDIHFVTPGPGAFTKPKATKVLTAIAEKKNINITANWGLGQVNAKEKWIENMQASERINYDLLVSIPTTVGDKAISDSGMDDGMGYVPTDHNTLKATKHDRVYVLGDATNVPTSKAGSVVHYQVEVVLYNILSEICGGVAMPLYDGHAT
ncbi:MAG TPA: FAD-dependent oxidoreductase [Anaerolineae bacterium]|jgi:sulfide:quinone oxidoreductase|nr:FAD-dependent oxidoreductase [Anaerolineae bacterium]